MTLEDAIQKVVSSLPENPIDSDSDCEIEDMEDIRIDSKVKGVSVSTSSAAVRGDQGGGVVNVPERMTENILENNAKTTVEKKDNSNDTALTVLNSERSIMAFTSPAADYFHTREFQGLLPIVPEGQNTSVQPGQYGIASTYKRYDKNAEENEKKENIEEKADS